MRSIYLLLSAIANRLHASGADFFHGTKNARLFTLNNNGDKIRWQTPRLQTGTGYSTYRQVNMARW